MTDENNVIDATDRFGPWEGNVDEDGNLLPPVEMTEDEYNTAMEELFNTVDADNVGRMIAGVLELLTQRAVHDAPYYILTDQKDAVTVIAANEDVTPLLESLPDNFKSWEDPMSEDNVVPFDTNSDPGDEQDEPATESE